MSKKLVADQILERLGAWGEWRGTARHGNPFGEPGACQGGAPGTNRSNCRRRHA